MHPDDQRSATHRQAFCAYLHAHAPRALNGPRIIDRDLLDAALAAGDAAVAAVEPVTARTSSSGNAVHGLVRG